MPRCLSRFVCVLSNNNNNNNTRGRGVVCLRRASLAPFVTDLNCLLLLPKRRCRCECITVTSSGDPHLKRLSVVLCNLIR